MSMYIIPLIMLIFEIFITLVFLEIIELKFCGLNTNIAKNIKKRALEDFNDSLLTKKKIYEIDNDYFINYDDIEEENNEKNDKIELINN